MKKFFKIFKENLPLQKEKAMTNEFLIGHRL